MNQSARLVNCKCNGPAVARVGGEREAISVSLSGSDDGLYDAGLAPCTSDTTLLSYKDAIMQYNHRKFVKLTFRYL